MSDWRIREPVDPRSVKPPASPSGVVPPRSVLHVAMADHERRGQEQQQRISDLKVRLQDRAHPYVPSDPIDVEVVETRQDTPVHVTPNKPGAGSAVLAVSSKAKSAVKISTFVTFVLLGAGVWGWGPIGTFLFAVVVTAVIDTWLDGTRISRKISD